MNDVFRCGMGAIAADADADVGQPFAVAAVLALHEGGEDGLADLARTLIEVMHHVLGQQGEHGWAVAGIEGGKIGGDELMSGMGRSGL